MFRPAVLLLCLVAAGSALAGSAERGRCQVDGLVTDQDGRPLHGVQIRLQRQNTDDALELLSNELGHWAARNIAAGDWVLTFSQAGYLEQSMLRTVYPRAKLNRTRIALRKTPFGPGLAEAGFEPISDPRAPPTPAPEEAFAIPEGKPQEVAKALFQQGHYRAAVTRFEALLEAQPERSSLHQDIGDCYLRLGDYAAALMHYQDLLDADPESAAALSDLAEVYLKRKEIDKALVYLNMIVQKNPTHPTANYNLAEILLSADEPEAAISHYEAALAGRPDWAEAYLRLGYAALGVGRSGKAREAFERYLLLAPDGAEASFVRETMKILK
jgi:tetratricopeptide (TPR) repeat protein